MQPGHRNLHALSSNSELASIAFSHVLVSGGIGIPRRQKTRQWLSAPRAAQRTCAHEARKWRAEPGGTGPRRTGSKWASSPKGQSEDGPIHNLRDGQAGQGRQLTSAIRPVVGGVCTIAGARKRSQDALAFNALDASWPEIQRLMASMDRGGQQRRFG